MKGFTIKSGTVSKHHNGETQYNCIIAIQLKYIFRYLGFTEAEQMLNAYLLVLRIVGYAHTVLIEQILCICQLVSLQIAAESTQRSKHTLISGRYCMNNNLSS